MKTITTQFNGREFRHDTAPIKRYTGYKVNPNSESRLNTSIDIVEVIEENNGYGDDKGWVNKHKAYTFKGQTFDVWDSECGLIYKNLDDAKKWAEHLDSLTKVKA